MSGDKKARIAVMLPRFSRYGGVEQFGYRLAEALAQKEYSVDFICARQETKAPEGVQVIAVGRPPGAKVIKMLWFLVKAEQARKAGNYDLTISLGKTWNQDLTRVGGGPLRIFWRKSERAIPSGKLRWKKRMFRYLSPSNWLTLIIEKHQFTKESDVIAVSHLVRDWLLEAHPSLNPERVMTVYNRPDLTRFAPPQAGERQKYRNSLAAQVELSDEQGNSESKESSNSVVFMGTATTNFQLKGIAPLIRALAVLPKNVHFFIAGGRGTAKYVSLAKSLGVAGRVHFCGKIDDMPSFYKGLDVFVLDTFYDACSNAVLEALASGCKVLTTSSNGASRFLPEISIINDPSNVRLLREQIQHLLDAPQPEAFIWPDSVDAGIDAFIQRIEARLQKSGRVEIVHRG